MCSVVSEEIAGVPLPPIQELMVEAESLENDVTLDQELATTHDRRRIHFRSHSVVIPSRRHPSSRPSTPRSLVTSSDARSRRSTLLGPRCGRQTAADPRAEVCPDSGTGRRGGHRRVLRSRSRNALWNRLWM